MEKTKDVSAVCHVCRVTCLLRQTLVLLSAVVKCVVTTGEDMVSPHNQTQSDDLTHCQKPSKNNSRSKLSIGER